MVVAVLIAGVFLWNISGTPAARPAVTQQEKAAILQAVHRMLTEAHVAPQDLPKRILSVKQLGEKRYQCHMEMVQGDAWFEVWWDGSRWQVKGINPPGAGS